MSMTDLEQMQADDRAHRIATIAAEDFVRCNGMATDVADQFVMFGQDVQDEYAFDCIQHLKHVGQCVTFDTDDGIVVQLGDYTLGSLA